MTCLELFDTRKTQASLPAGEMTGSAGFGSWRTKSPQVAPRMSSFFSAS